MHLQDSYTCTYMEKQSRGVKIPLEPYTKGFYACVSLWYLLYVPCVSQTLTQVAQQVVDADVHVVGVSTDHCGVDIL